MDMSNIPGVRDKLMLARLSISSWGNRKVDKQASEHVHQTYATDASAGRYNKTLLPKAAVEKIIAAHNQARAAHYRLTLPWADDGYRVLTAAAHLDYVNDMMQWESATQQAVHDLCRKLPHWMAEAQKMHGSLFNAADYPDEHALQAAYSFAIHIMPMPAAEDFRVDLGDDVVNVIKSDIEKRVADAQQSAFKDVFARIAENVGHMAEKLADPEAIFRDSLVNNVTDLVAVLPKLNFYDDPGLSIVIEQMKQLVVHEPKELRLNAQARQQTATKAAGIASKVKGWL